MAGFRRDGGSHLFIGPVAFAGYLAYREFRLECIDVGDLAAPEILRFGTLAADEVLSSFLSISCPEAADFSTSSPSKVLPERLHFTVCSGSAARPVESERM